MHRPWQRIRSISATPLPELMAHWRGTRSRVSFSPPSHLLSVAAVEGAAGGAEIAPVSDMQAENGSRGAAGQYELAPSHVARAMGPAGVGPRANGRSLRST